MKSRYPRFLTLILCVTALLAGCSRTQSERGIEPLWRDLPASALVAGTTTKSELLALLGPPSQVITHENGEIFYYLHEKAQSEALILVVYNTSQSSTHYDRAIFFFDRGGVLEDYSMSAREPGR